MSCYLRNIQDIIEKAGIKLTKDNRKSVDHAIRRAIGKPESNCSEIWKELKLMIADGRKDEIINGLLSEYKE